MQDIPRGGVLPCWPFHPMTAMGFFSRSTLPFLPPGAVSRFGREAFPVQTRPPFGAGAEFPAAGGALRDKGVPPLAAGAEFQGKGVPLFRTGAEFRTAGAAVDKKGAEFRQMGAAPIPYGGGVPRKGGAPIRRGRGVPGGGGSAARKGGGAGKAGRLDRRPAQAGTPVFRAGARGVSRLYRQPSSGRVSVPIIYVQEPQFPLLPSGCAQESF